MASPVWAGVMKRMNVCSPVFYLPVRNFLQMPKYGFLNASFRGLHGSKFKLTINDSTVARMVNCKGKRTVA